MSSTAPQLRSRLPRLAEAAVERARLTVVPRRRSRAPRIPFVTLVSLLLLGGVIGLLLFNTSMQQASFAATALEEQATNLSAREQTLQMELERLRDPQRVAEAAKRQGLVIPLAPAFLDLGTGKVTGSPAPATAEGDTRITAPPPTRPPELDPDPIRLKTRGGSVHTRDGVGTGDGGHGKPKLGQRDRGGNHQQPR
jgi:cell division protein FtsB